MTFKNLLSWMMLCCFAAFAAGCGEAASTPDRIASRGFTRVASVQLEAPLFYLHGQDVVGPETEIVRRTVDKLNAAREVEGSRPNELVYIKREYPDLLAAVENGEAELAIGAIGVTDERKGRVDFSNSYYTAKLVLVMNPSYKRITAAEMKGQKIGVRRGTAVESWARSNHAEVEFVPFTSLDEALLSLRRAEIEGVVDLEALAAYALDTGVGLGHLEILPGDLGSLDVAVAVPKGNQILLDAVNKSVAEVVENGDFERLLQEQIGDKVASVRQRYEKRVAKERMASAPRRLLLRMTKDQGSKFDIYRIANLSFRLRDNKSGKTINTTRVQFNNKTGVSSASVPPGSYTLYSPSKFGNAPLGEILIKVDDGNQVNYNLRWKADDTISLLVG